MKNRRDVHIALRNVIRQATRRLAKGTKLSLYYREAVQGQNHGALLALRKPLSNTQYHRVAEISGFKTVDQNFNTLWPMLENVPILTV